MTRGNIDRNLIRDDFNMIKIKKGLNLPIAGKPNQKIIEVPVCYDVEFALDLKEMSSTLSIPVDEIISLHTKPTYRVYFIGFLLKHKSQPLEQL